jgi:hypothetical protein
MPHDTKRSLSIILFLLLALLLMAGFYGRAWWQNRSLANAQHYVFVTDIDRWRKTMRERELSARYDFSLGPQLNEIPLQLGDWIGEDVPQTNIEVQILLEPEVYIYRRYRRADGKSLWLSLIGSRQAKSFHPPQICYDAAGWRTDISSEEIPLDNGILYAMKVRAQKDAWTHVVLYFFLYPDHLRDPGRGLVLFKVTAPLTDSETATLEMEKAFIRQYFTDAK